MDIESGEFAAIPALFGKDQPQICQLLVEFHPPNAKDWLELFKIINKAGYLMFSREANTLCGACFEYSFIHNGCLQRFGINAEWFVGNF